MSNIGKQCCIECKLWFKDISSHMKNKHKDDRKKKCDLCPNNSVFSVSGLKRHRKMVHNITSEEKTLRSVAPAKLVYDTQKKKVTNEKGQKVLLEITLDPTTGYIKIPNDIQIDKMDKVELKKYILEMSKESKFLQVQLEANRDYIKIPTDAEMDIMEKDVLEQYLRDLFEESKGLREELESQSKNSPLPTNNPSNLTKVGIIEKPFKCDICDSDFLSNDELGAHMKSVHEGNKFLPSSQLEAESENHKLPDENDFGLVFVKETNTSTTLRENSVHEGKKPFKCDNCVSVNKSEHLSETVIELQDKLEKERNECKERAKECLSWKAKFEESEKQNKKLAKEVEKEKEMARENLLVKVA